LGAYVFHAIHTTNVTWTYVQNWGDWKSGEVYKCVWRSHLTVATPGGEGSIGFAYKLSSSVSLGITGRLILISKVTDVTETTSYYQTDWDPKEPELTTVKDGNEYGGIGWGISASLLF